MVGIVRIYQDSYGNNMGARTFCQLSKYFGGVLITDNKKIQELDFKQITHEEALLNKAKFTKIIVYNTKPNMFGGVASRHTAYVVSLILSVKDVYYYNCDPILSCPTDVADSHEKQVPGLRQAIFKLNKGTTLDRRNTDLTKFLAAQIQHPIMKVGSVEKQWISVYFGNPRGHERQKQVNELFRNFNTALIIGYEHATHAWFNYTPDFYETLSSAWTTPIIGDKKMHYETGIPSIRLYEAWHTTTVALVDRRFTVPGLDDSFYFSTPQEFKDKTHLINTYPKVYKRMIEIQQKLLKKIKKQFKNKTYDWSIIRKLKAVALKERKQHTKQLKDTKINGAKQRLAAKGLIKERRKRAAV
jgi:hypothetical protein